MMSEPPPSALASAGFRPIPRGGWIVLGLLAYHLELPRERLHPAALEGSNGPLVLVDDCALSGLRLRQALAAVPQDRPVIVAHLFSCPELRRAVLAAEPRVVACIAAHDLADQSRALFPDPAEHAAWRRRWSERLDVDRRYWLGLPELVAFPWNEPDRPFWNPATGRVEDGWRFVPPHLCAKNRARLAAGLPEVARRRIGEDDGSARWWSSDAVAWGEFDDEVWLVNTRAETVFSLRGTASLAWRTVVAGGGEATAAAALAALYDVSQDAARRDVAGLCDELAAAGLLVPAGGSGANLVEER